MDKACSVSENGAVTASFTYDVDGQIATAKTHATGKQESFLWDGLALIHRGGTSYINEPYVTGGNPILAEDKVLFNDMLGTTLGVHSEKYEPIARDAFGMTSKDADSAENFFTGKPYIGELGYAFLFRNYRPELGKWQTTDPLGYPDGWNNLAYVNNCVVIKIDFLGGEEKVVIVIYKENTSVAPHTWAEVHNNGKIDTAAGFYPNASGEWGTPGQVLIGNNEYHTNDDTKVVKAVYQVSETDATTVIQSSYNYFHNNQIYDPLDPRDNVCWDFTDFMEDMLDEFGYNDISDKYIPADLKPDQNTHDTINSYVNRFE